MKQFIILNPCKHEVKKMPKCGSSCKICKCKIESLELITEDSNNILKKEKLKKY